MSDLDEIKTALKWNPAVLQAKATKFAVIGFIVLGLIVGSYLVGRHDGKQGALSALKTVAAKVAETRAGNAVDATARFGQYISSDRELEVSVTDLLKQVDDYYATHKPEPQVINKTRLVPVPGKPEYVYVPTDSCPSNFLNDDELRLYNMGNKRSDLNSGDSR